MARTTLNLDTPLLEELKKLQLREGKTLGDLVSELVAEALARRASGKKGSARRLSWTTKPMGARVDLSDKEAVYAILDSDAEGRVAEP